MERPALTSRFVIGAALIVASLIIGKLVFVPLLLFPTDTTWRTSMIVLYAFSWIMILFGIYIAGTETYRFVKYKYGEYSQRTFDTVKRHGTNAARSTARAFRRSPRKQHIMLR